MTPPLQPGLADHVWEIKEELVSLIAEEVQYRADVATFSSDPHSACRGKLDGRPCSVGLPGLSSSGIDTVISQPSILAVFSCQGSRSTNLFCP
jgi:hypothetical protein